MNELKYFNKVKTLSGKSSVTKNFIIQLIDSYLSQIDILETNENRNTREILQWLKSLSKSLSKSSLHAALDMCGVIKDRLVNESIEEILENNPFVKYVGSTTENTWRQRYYFATTFANYLSKKYNKPVRVSQRPIKNLFYSPTQLFPGNEDQSAFDDQTKLVYILCTKLGLRISEALRLKSHHVIITDQILVFVVKGKRGKDRTVLSEQLDSDLLENTKRLYEKLKGKNFPDNALITPVEQIDSTYSRIYYRFRKTNTWKSTHAMRRFFLNHHRANDIDLVNLANLGGQSSTKTPAESYILIQQLLQRDQFIRWCDMQKYFSTPEIIPFPTNAFFHQVSHPGLKKIISNDNKNISITESINHLRRRILNCIDN